MKSQIRQIGPLSSCSLILIIISINLARGKQQHQHLKVTHSCLPRTLSHSLLSPLFLTLSCSFPHAASGSAHSTRSAGSADGQGAEHTAVALHLQIAPRGAAPEPAEHCAALAQGWQATASAGAGCGRQHHQ